MMLCSLLMLITTQRQTLLPLSLSNFAQAEVNLSVSPFMVLLLSSFMVLLLPPLLLPGDAHQLNSLGLQNLS